MKIQRSVLCGMLAVLAGCANLSVQSRVQMTAAALKPAIGCTGMAVAPGDKNTIPGSNCTQGDDDVERVHDLVQDSQQKCANFVVGMFASNAKTSTYLDVATTSFTALATVFTPLNTVHSLTAAGTIASGTKTSIQNNYLNSLTLSHIVQAVQTSYSTQMSQYIAFLDRQEYVDVYKERSTILSIHALCSLPQAEGTIQSMLAPDETIAPKAAGLSLKFTVNGETTPELVAKSFAAQLTSDADFVAAGISAVRSTTQPKQVNFAVDSSKVQSVTWKEPVVVGKKTVAGVDTVSAMSAAFADGFASLSFSGVPKDGDTITITTDTIGRAAADVRPKVVYGARVRKIR